MADENTNQPTAPQIAQPAPRHPQNILSNCKIDTRGEGNILHQVYAEGPFFMFMQGYLICPLEFLFDQEKIDEYRNFAAERGIVGVVKTKKPPANRAQRRATQKKPAAKKTTTRRKKSNPGDNGKV